MNEHVHLIGREIEEPAGFNDLETLVGHGRGVDGDAIAHLPGGMIQRLPDRPRFQFMYWRPAEWTAASRQNELADFGMFASAHALMHAVVLAIHGQQCMRAGKHSE